MLMVEEAYLPLTITVPGITNEQFRRCAINYENCRVEYWQLWRSWLSESFGANDLGE